jgi:hypothetical protein
MKFEVEVQAPDIRRVYKDISRVEVVAEDTQGYISTSGLHVGDRVLVVSPRNAIAVHLRRTS